MTPETILKHADQGLPWASQPGADPGYDLDAAYRDALAVRALRIARGERPLGFKVGFTNRGIWPVYQVYAPVWGSVWDHSVVFCEGEGRLSLQHICEPRIEPEAVFGLRRDVSATDGLDALFDAIDWVAPGFEVVQSHLPGWVFEAADTVADGALHARLLVGRPVPVRSVAPDAAGLQVALAACRVRLQRDGRTIDGGCGSAVLDDPLSALRHVVQALADQPGAPTLRAGDVITTGTWTDAWPVEPGQTWQADFDAPLTPLTVRFTA